MIAGGIWGSSSQNKYSLEQKYIMRDRKDHLPAGINWVKEEIISLEPDSNTIRTQNSTCNYDYLIMASGVELRYDLIPGSMEALLDEDCPAGSMYRLDFAHKISFLRQNFKGGKAVFTLP